MNFMVGRGASALASAPRLPMGILLVATHDGLARDTLIAALVERAPRNSTRRFVRWMGAERPPPLKNAFACLQAWFDHSK